MACDPEAASATSNPDWLRACLMRPRMASSSSTLKMRAMSPQVSVVGEGWLSPSCRDRAGLRASHRPQEVLGRPHGVLGRDPAMASGQVGDGDPLKDAPYGSVDVPPQLLKATARVLEARVVFGLEAVHREVGALH